MPLKPALSLDVLAQDALARGIDVQQRCVPTAELQQLLLAGQHLVIALVDKDSLEGGLALWSSSHHSPAEDSYKGLSWLSSTSLSLVRSPTLIYRPH